VSSRAHSREGGKHPKISHSFGVPAEHSNGRDAVGLGDRQCLHANDEAEEIYLAARRATLPVESLSVYRGPR
jgi:hypothetical protein